MQPWHLFVVILAGWISHRRQQAGAISAVVLHAERRGPGNGANSGAARYFDPTPTGWLLGRDANMLLAAPTWVEWV